MNKLKMHIIPDNNMHRVREASLPCTRSQAFAFCTEVLTLHENPDTQRNNRAYKSRVNLLQLYRPCVSGLRVTLVYSVTSGYIFWKPLSEDCWVETPVSSLISCPQYHWALWFILLFLDCLNDSSGDCLNRITILFRCAAKWCSASFWECNSRTCCIPCDECCGYTRINIQGKLITPQESFTVGTMLHF